MHLLANVGLALAFGDQLLLGGDLAVEPWPGGSGSAGGGGAASVPGRWGNNVREPLSPLARARRCPPGPGSPPCT